MGVVVTGVLQASKCGDATVDGLQELIHTNIDTCHDGDVIVVQWHLRHRCGHRLQPLPAVTHNSARQDLQRQHDGIITQDNTVGKCRDYHEMETCEQ